MNTPADTWSTLATEGQFRRAIEASPFKEPEAVADGYAAEVLGYCHGQLGEHARALRFLKRAVDLGNRGSYVELFRARAHAALGQSEAAIDRYCALLAAWPVHDPEALPEAINLIPTLPKGPSTSRLLWRLARRVLRSEVPSDQQAAFLFLAGHHARLRKQLEATEGGPRRLSLRSGASVAQAVALGGGRLLDSGVAEEIDFAPPHDLRDVAAPTLRVAANDPYLADLHDVLIVGGSSLVFQGTDLAISDTLADPRFGRFVDMRYDPIVVRQSPTALLVATPPPSRRLSRGFHLAGLASNQFGHWFAEFLPKLRHLERIDGGGTVPLIVDDDMPPSHDEFLRLISTRPVLRLGRGETVRVDSLLVAPTTTFFPTELVPGHGIPQQNQAAWTAEAMRFVRERVLASFSAPPSRHCKIYLSRRNSRWRRLVNEGEIESVLQGMGFEAVLLEEHGFADQVRIMQQASFIVAANGSSLNSLIFADPGVKTLVLGQRSQFNWGGWLGPIRALGFDPRFLTGETTGLPGEKHADYTVAAEDVRRAVDLVAAEVGSQP